MREESGVAAGLNALPSGGGSISPLGERFQPDLVRGSGSYAVPINCPKGPNELQPKLMLTYSTGSGNGSFGFGWRLNILRIERRSDRGLPGYNDDDTFVIGDAELLVSVGGNRYRPKTDNKFWQIERLDESWRIRTGDGKVMFFGQTATSRESQGERIFAWYLDAEQDAAGNIIHYAYQQDGNRLYLESVQYSIFTLRIAYENRPDVQRNGRSGFERLTSLRARAIELHCDRLAPTLMRTYAFTYEQAANSASLLTRLSLSASEAGETASFPDLTFEYARPDFTDWDIHEIQSYIPPPSLEDKTAQLVDMTGDGLPDILQSVGSTMLLWRNQGDGWLNGPTAMDGMPSTVSLQRENVAFADLDGNGRVDLFAVDQSLQLAFSATGKGGFQPDPIVFHNQPSLRLAATDTRLMDIDGDGVIDLINTGKDFFLLFRHQPGVGWQEPQPVARITDLEQFPDITFGDRGIRLSDMTGDGLQDLVSVLSGNVCYWPYLGGGVWAKRVEMENSPQFPSGYREEQIHLLDLDGDGCSDVVYMGHDRILIWLNQSGQGFAAPIELPVWLNGASERVIPADFFGDGRLGLVWSSTANSEYGTGYRFLRFGQGNKPYLMTAIQNGMGGHFEMEYSTSTTMRLADQAEGVDWSGELPFVAHVVKTIRDHDQVTGRTTELSLRYHDGVFDGIECEFRGFRRVTVDLSGDESIPASRQECEFFQGDLELVDLAERDRQRVLAGSLQVTKMYEWIDNHYILRNESNQTWATRLEYENGGKQVFFPFIAQIETREHSLGTAPSRIERTQLLDYDAYGNPGKRLRESLFEGMPPDQWIRTEEYYSYTNNEADWLVKLPVRLELRDNTGAPFAIKIHYYDGNSFVGLPEGQIMKGLRSRIQELKLLESRLPVNYVGDRDFTSLGYELIGAGDTRGYYATTFAVERNVKGNVVEQQDPMGRPFGITFDTDGIYPLETKDALGKVTRFAFNPKSGEPSKIDFPDGRSLRYESDPIGRLVASFETDDAGQEQLVRCWVLDINTLPNSAISIVPQTGGHTRAEFASGTDFATLQDVSVARAFYDGFGNQILQIATTTDGQNGERRFVASKQVHLNSRNLVSTQFAPRFVADLEYLPPDPLNIIVHQCYDLQGNVMETAGPGPVHQRVVRDTTTINHYEGAGAGVFGIVEPPGPKTRVEYFDPRDRLIRIEEAVGDGTEIVTQYELATDGRIALIRDNAGQEVVRYTFVGPAEPIRITHRDVGIRTYYRNAAGNPVERIDPDGSSLVYSYDLLGRLTTISQVGLDNPQPKVVRQIFYDADPDQPYTGQFLEGRIALARELGSEIRYSYNRVGKIVREEVTTDGVTLITRQEYSLQGQLTAIIYPDGHRVNYSLDHSGAVRHIPGIITTTLYDADSMLTNYQLANGVDITMPRDAVSRRLTSVSARKDGSQLRHLTYTYDTVGNIIGIKDEMPDGTENQEFIYDGLYRLRSFEIRQNDSNGMVLRTGTYGYDATGNLLQLAEIQPLVLSYTDAAHSGRLTTVTNGADTQTLRYNSRGHISAFGNLKLIEFDPFDRIARIVKADGTDLRFAYDPQSRRILKKVTQGGLSTTIRYATGLYEQHPTHSIRHIYLGSQLIASEKVSLDQTNVAYYLSDHHGTILLATDAAGKVIHNQQYSPFGAALNQSQALDRYLGRERDVETGLIHFGARHYSPVLGRFISPDWFVLENPTKPMRIPQGYNLYSYALNNPLVFKDPSGLWFGIDDLIVAGVGFAVGFTTGLIYGLANGQGWGSFLTALETGLTTAAGAWLGWTIAGPLGAIMGGMNGLVSGIHGIYDWGSVDGWLAFVSDSTWGLLGTSMGNIVHVINLFGNTTYREDLSRRQNRHVYEGGFYLKKGFAFTQGNVISNAGFGGKGISLNVLNNHESLHIWQSRIFGPLFQGTYVAWAEGGFVVGSVVGFFHTDQKYGSFIETAVYYDNPFEYWAYKNADQWPPSEANPTMRWG